MNRPTTVARPAENRFEGFAPLSSNYVFCPNQFFEVCIRHYPRGVVRLVSYVIRQTLGFIDKDGLPLSTNIPISYLDISRNAGVSLRAIPSTIEEAKPFLNVTAGLANSSGRRGRKGVCSLRWSDEAYTCDLDKFSGFYSGEGYRSPVPNGFFDIVVPNETLCMTKVVGTVLRHTVGYRNQFGTGRRQQAELTYDYIQQFANINDRSTLSKTLKEGCRKNYIECVSQGVFDKNAGLESRPSSYAVKWLQFVENRLKTAKTQPEQHEDGKKPIEKTAFSLPVKDGKKTTIIKENLNKTYKQKAAAVDLEILELLQPYDFELETLQQISDETTAEIVQDQLDRLPYRKVHTNPKEILRRSILGNWDDPRESQRSAGVLASTKPSYSLTNILLEQRDEQSTEQKRRNNDRRALLSRFLQLSGSQQEKIRQRALESNSSESIRRLIRDCDLQKPHRAVLLQFQIEHSVHSLNS